VKQRGRLPRNTHAGQFVATVEKLGYVPVCVRDAFSWLPHPWGKAGRSRDSGLIWFWQGYAGEYGRPPSPEQPSGSRCRHCVFQEPSWSQGYAGCSHSWLHDRDDECRAFLDRAELLARLPGYAQFCQPPQVAPELLHTPYWSDGTTYAAFGPSCNFPSGYYARLNVPEWVASGAERMYQAVEGERLRRFWQWAEEETIRRAGVFQPNLFLSSLWDEEGGDA
jgi:hypothetical protein